MHARGDQARDMRHVHHEIGAHLIGDGPEGVEIDDPRVGAGAGQDHLRLALQGLGAHVGHVDAAVGVGAVEYHVIELAALVDARAVGQVPAVVQAHGKQSVPGLHDGLVGRQVGLAAGMGLHVHVVIGIEYLFPGLAAQVLHLIHDLASAVITLSGHALGVLVGQAAAHRFFNVVGYKVFGGDQLNGFTLTLLFLRDQAEHLGFDVIHGGAAPLSMMICHRRGAQRTAPGYCSITGRGK